MKTAALCICLVGVALAAGQASDNVKVRDMNARVVKLNATMVRNNAALQQQTWFENKCPFPSLCQKCGNGRSVCCPYIPMMSMPCCPLMSQDDRCLGFADEADATARDDAAAAVAAELPKSGEYGSSWMMIPNSKYFFAMEIWLVNSGSSHGIVRLMTFEHQQHELQFTVMLGFAAECSQLGPQTPLEPLSLSSFPGDGSNHTVELSVTSLERLHTHPLTLMVEAHDGTKRPHACGVLAVSK